MKPCLNDFEHNLTILWNESNCKVVWTIFTIAFCLDWIENRPFPVLWPWLSFPYLLAYWVQHFEQHDLFRIWNSSTGIPSPPLALFVVMLLKALYVAGASYCMVAGFQVGCPNSKCLKRREANFANLLKGQSSNWHSIISTLFYCFKQSQASLDSRVGRNGLYL